MDIHFQICFGCGMNKRASPVEEVFTILDRVGGNSVGGQGVFFKVSDFFAEASGCAWAW